MSYAIFHFLEYFKYQNVKTKIYEFLSEFKKIFIASCLLLVQNKVNEFKVLDRLPRGLLYCIPVICLRING
jgi:hypothetical protein